MTAMSGLSKLGLHCLGPKPGSRHRPKRLGCGSGSGHGQTSTRGQKGQRSRSGDGKLVGFEGGQTPLLRRIPKRGFRNTAFRVRYQTVDLKDLSRVFGNQTEASIDAMRLHGLVQGRAPVKVLGDGALKTPLKVQGHAFSRSAREKIEGAGGSAELIAT